jgi:NAD-dependent dihydropyrimidine dehydrogenase PreA subunit
MCPAAVGLQGHHEFIDKGERMDNRTWKTETYKITIDYDACNGNGTCVEVCPTEVYELAHDKAVPVGIDKCIECCACVDNCPQQAITHTSC